MPRGDSAYDGAFDDARSTELDVYGANSGTEVAEGGAWWLWLGHHSWAAVCCRRPGERYTTCQRAAA
eukprot:gene4555-61861_t